jgi:hypothetical protein
MSSIGRNKRTGIPSTITYAFRRPSVLCGKLLADFLYNHKQGGQMPSTIETLQLKGSSRSLSFSVQKETRVNGVKPVFGRDFCCISLEV